jgi:hypothetical protein
LPTGLVGKARGTLGEDFRPDRMIEVDFAIVDALRLLLSFLRSSVDRIGATLPPPLAYRS